MLCAACKYDPTCIYQIDSEGPILECAQFELGAGESQTEVPLGSPRDDKSSDRFAGLCVSCENRDTCIYPKPEGGVWRCEGYS